MLKLSRLAAMALVAFGVSTFAVGTSGATPLAAAAGVAAQPAPDIRTGAVIRTGGVDGLLQLAQGPARYWDRDARRGQRYHRNRHYGRHWDRPRYSRRHYNRGPSINLHLGVPSYRYAQPRYVQPRYDRRLIGTRAHVDWCYARYRSYRASDNTYQPYGGPRRQCFSPYS